MTANHSEDPTTELERARMLGGFSPTVTAALERVFLEIMRRRYPDHILYLIPPEDSNAVREDGDEEAHHTTEGRE